MTTRLVSCLCVVTLCALAAMAPAQEKSHDALAHARAKAQAENQRVLLYLTGGDAAVDEQLMKALDDYRTLGKLLRYEYKLVALPATSLAGTAIRKRLDLAGLALPALAALSTEDKVLGTLGAGQASENDRVRGFLKKHGCAPLHAREILASALETAKRSKRLVFLYLSAPW